MALESNVMELISPAAAAIPGTVSATLSRLSTWRGEDADGAFDERIDALAGSVDPDAAARVTVERIDMGNPAACYWSVSGESLGRSIRARLVLPSGQGAHPLILMFHDAGRPVRGWHHMTRFAGVGMAVLALDQEEGPFEDVLLDAIALKAATRAVSVLDPSSISTWGEGLGEPSLWVSRLFRAAISRVAPRRIPARPPCAGIAEALSTLRGASSAQPLWVPALWMRPTRWRISSRWSIAWGARVAISSIQSTDASASTRSRTVRSRICSRPNRRFSSVER